MDLSNYPFTFMLSFDATQLIHYINPTLTQAKGINFHLNMSSFNSLHFLSHNDLSHAVVKCRFTKGLAVAV